MRREVRLFDELDRFARGGEITQALAFTFGYDGDVAAERIFTPLIEKYGVRHPLVIASGVVDEGTALGIHVLRAHRKAGFFHPKLFLAVREDAVFAAIGSANLTRGGLGANLELMTALVFGKDTERPPPRAALESILGFARKIIAGLSVADDSRAKALDVITAAEIVQSELPEPRKTADLRFLHSCEEPLWDQLRAMHGDDAVVHVAVVSPFFEVDDPALDESDSLLRYALSDGLSWASRAKSPRCTLHTAALGGLMPLPRAALEELGAVVEVRPQALSVEPRRLHGKLVAVFGKKRTTVLWGSPNFTPAALLRSAKAGGNVECALALTTGAAAVDLETVIEEFELGQVFHAHRGPLPEGSFHPPQPQPHFEIGEVLYDPETHVLAVHGEIWSSAVRQIRVRLGDQEESPVLLDGQVERTGPFSFAAEVGQIEEEDPETGKQRLRSLTVVVEAIDAAGAVCARNKVRINIRFEDAIEVRQNLLLGKEALSADALLVPSSAPPEQRIAAIDGQIALWKAARKGENASPSRHQASLDAFFRNVRRGLDARWENLERRRGSRFALLRWSHDLRRSLGVAQAESMAGARRLYLVARVAAHIEQVLAAIPTWHDDPVPAYAVLEADKVAAALAAVPLEGGAHPEVVDETVAACARAIEMLESLGGDVGARTPSPDGPPAAERKAKRGSTYELRHGNKVICTHKSFYMSRALCVSYGWGDIWRIDRDGTSVKIHSKQKVG